MPHLCLSAAICACVAVCKCLCFRHSHSNTLWFIVSFSYTTEFETFWVWKYDNMLPCWPCKRWMLRQGKSSTNPDALETTWNWCLSSQNDKTQHLSLSHHEEIPESYSCSYVVSLHFKNDYHTAVAYYPKWRLCQLWNKQITIKSIQISVCLSLVLLCFGQL